MLHSVCQQATGHGVHVHYLHGPAFPERSLNLLQGMIVALGGTMTAHEIAPRRVAGLPVVAEFTVAMWYRVLLPELLPDVDRVLYVDVDTLAVDALAPLWDTDLADAYLGAVTNVFMPHHRHRPETLGLPGRDVYFNSGVLLLNLHEMRRDDCTARLLSIARDRGAALEWPDQDALNLVLGERRVALHPRWNAMNSLRLPWSIEVFGSAVVEEARRSPAIRHFEGPGANKPWAPGCDPRDRKLYYQHRRETPWRGSRLKNELHGRFGAPPRPGLRRARALRRRDA